MIKAITGTKDIFASEVKRWHYLENLVKRIFENFNYNEIRTPVFEETALFARGIGESTDIVSKEMYTFVDRGDTSLTLKPEMTAAVVRAALEHSFDKQQNLNKLYYISPMFRQERPQAGRFRQFHQFGAEALGSESPALDAEMIIIAHDIIAELGLKNFKVKINSLGVPASRENYKAKLKEYLEPHFDKLSDESKKRFNSNILRIFDSKDETDQNIMKDAPLLIEHLEDESLIHFDEVKKYLMSANVNFEIDPRLVRGLDYYTHTTFEIISDSVGSQSALCGGGRYNKLAAEIGDRDIPGVGFAAGIERILLACENENAFQLVEDSIDVYVVRIDKELNQKAYQSAYQLRKLGLLTEVDYLSRSVKAQMREANKLNAKYVIMIGGDEFQKGNFLLKNMKTSEQEELSLDNLEQVYTRIRG